MFARTLATPRSAFFLFGPRGTGKSTWIRTALPDALVVNLLRADEMIRYQREPGSRRDPEPDRVPEPAYAGSSSRRDARTGAPASTDR